MNNIPDKDLTMEQSEKALNLRIDEFLEKFNPQEMEDVAFRSARFDAGLAWIHFPEGQGGMGLRPNLQKVIERRMREAGAMPTDPTTFFMSLAGLSLIHI